jgi:hypothetical protein
MIVRVASFSGHGNTLDNAIMAAEDKVDDFLEKTMHKLLNASSQSGWVEASSEWFHVLTIMYEDGNAMQEQ